MLIDQLTIFPALLPVKNPSIAYDSILNMIYRGSAFQI